MSDKTPSPTKVATTQQQRLEALHQSVTLAKAIVASGSSVNGTQVRNTAESFAEFLAGGTR